MPYKPNEKSEKDQMIQWYLNHPDKFEEDSASGRSSVPIILDTVQDKKREYYDRPENKGSDPQSYYSAVLDFFGMDTPYANNETSYDYRNDPSRWSQFEVDKKGDRIPESVNPHVAYMFPEVPSDEQRQNFYDEWVENPNDPRSTDEKNQAAILGALAWPLMGANDEAMAGAMSVLPGGGSYDEELKTARDLQKREEEHGRVFSPRNLASGAVNFLGAAPVISATQKLLPTFQKGTTLLGKAGEYAGKTASAAALGAGELGAYDFNSAEGGYENRARSIPLETLGLGAILGPTMYTHKIPKTIAKRAATGESKMRGVDRIIKAGKKAMGDTPVPGPTKPPRSGKPRDAAPGDRPNRPDRPMSPIAPPDAGLRGDIESSILKLNRKKR